MFPIILPLLCSLLKSMEAEGACRLYERSLRRHGMRYIPYVGHGDHSKSYASVTKSKPYGPGVFIPKEDCIGHVTKRMGTALRKVLTDYKGNINSPYMTNIFYLLKHYEKYYVKYLIHIKFSGKKLEDGKGIGGRGRLTAVRIDALQISMEKLSGTTKVMLLPCQRLPTRS